MEINSAENKQEYQPINLTYYNPNRSLFKSTQSDRERYTIYLCSNHKNCNAYKRGKCVQLNGLYGGNCPYGKRNTVTGYTKSARKCGILILEAQQKYKGLEYQLSSLSFLCEIGEYIYIPLPHLTNYVNSIRANNFFKGEYLIKAEDFTAEFIVELINYHPRALMGGTIESYQKKYVPQFIFQLKKYFPKKYEEALKIQPNIAKHTENISYIGKEAKVKTLLAGEVKHSIYTVYWDGKNITSTAKKIGLYSGFNGDEVVSIAPNDNTFVEILDNDSVTEDTEFKNE